MVQLARDRALAQPEILALVLSHLDMRTLLLAQRVSVLWREIVTKWSHLQQALFLKPAVALSDHELTMERQRNPLLAQYFPRFFLENTKNPDGYNVIRALTTANLDDFIKAPELRTLEPFLRHEASWRRMLVQQPAAYRFGYTQVKGRCEKAYYNAMLEEPEGVRMGALYDLVYSDMGCKKTRCCYSVYWREPDYDPPIYEPSPQHGDVQESLRAYERDVAIVIFSEIWQGRRATKESELYKEYLSKGWSPRDIPLKFIFQQCWFG
ncbi:hypothetical protein F5Y18DRAFT_117717 [Xylariaceae sp. FL1019]|nr:hypothetical protein F5Y18DRAFT_117717 [Xylariaceae sp. FL1019]